MAMNTASSKMEPALVTHGFATGRKPLHRLLTQRGRTLRATTNHKFLTVTGWRRLDQLKPGMEIALSGGLDRINSISPEGEDDVYDLTVEGLHNFVASDIVVHNSIEQDSDLVLFIYRDRFYNDNLPDDKRNIAELIIAKHRNGPVGKVELLFVDEQTRFVNLDRRR
jgi:replicative DNA helicase